MSKAAAAAIVGVGGTGLTIGGIYLSKKFNVDYEIPKELDDKFIESNGGSCVQSIFPGIAKMKQSEETLTDVGSGDVTFNGSEEARGCLVVNWDKWKGHDSNKDKWRGNFRFLWAMSKGTKGFIVYATADTSKTTTEKKMKVKGVRYWLEKEKDEWKIKKGKKVSEEKELEGSKIPKPDAKLQGMDAKSPKWGFADDDANLEKLCTEEECKGDEPSEFFRGYWIFGKGGTDAQEAHKWTSNIDEWWKVIYEEDTNWKMSTVLASVKGEWKQKGQHRSAEPIQQEEAAKAN